MQVKRLQLLPVFLLFLLAAVVPASAVDQAVTVSIPDAVLYQTVKDILPLPIETQAQYVRGDVILQSLQKLQVREKSLYLQGVVAGRDFTMHTTIAGKEIVMNLGSVELPVACELFLRFDKHQKILFIRPYFSKPQSLYTADPTDALRLVLATLNDREYPVELDDIQPILAKAGQHNIRIDLEPVDIQMQGGLLLIKMRPRVAKAS